MLRDRSEWSQRGLTFRLWSKVSEDQRIEMGSRSGRKFTKPEGHRIRSVIRYDDCYMLSMRKKRKVDKWSVPKATVPIYLRVYSVPYMPVGGTLERKLQFTLIAEVGTNWSGRGSPLGLMLKRYESSLEDVAELAGMSWHLVGWDGWKHSRMSVPQPVAIWTYGPGDSVVACAEGEKLQPIDAWLAEAQPGRGRRRLWDKAAADRSAKPHVENATGPHVLETHDKEGRVRRLSPIEISYPFSDVQKWARRPREREIDGDRGRTLEQEHLRSTISLPWRLLPPGEVSESVVLKHYEDLAQNDTLTRYEPERIRKAFSLGPDACYVGTDEFYGYVVFTFPHTEKALLECPIYGHAIYILDADWRRLSRLSKGALLADRKRGVRKIIHRGDWFARVKRALEFR